MNHPVLIGTADTPRPHTPHLRVLSVFLKQRLVAALLHDPPMLQHDNAVGKPCGGQAMHFSFRNVPNTFSIVSLPDEKARKGLISSIVMLQSLQILLTKNSSIGCSYPGTSTIRPPQSLYPSFL